MVRLLMTLGFTKSKEDSNLCFKVEGGRPMILLLYVDDLFLIEKRNSLKLKEGDLLLSFVDVFVTSKCIHLYILCLVPDVYSRKCL